MLCALVIGMFSRGDARTKHGCQRKRDGTFSMFGLVSGLEDIFLMHQDTITIKLSFMGLKTE